MKSGIYDNNIASYVHQVMNDLVGKPEFGRSWDTGKVIKVDNVPEKYRGVVQEAAGTASSLTGLDLKKALWAGHNAIIKEDKTFGIHTSPYSLMRNFGIGGNGIIEPKEQKRAATKSPMAMQMLQLIETQRSSQ